MITKSEVEKSLYYPPQEGSGWRLPKHIRFYSYARYALVEAFKILNLKNGDAVLLPDLICRDVLASVYQTGLQLRFYSVDQNLHPLKLTHESNIKAVVAVNYFGIPQPLKVFREFCERQGCHLIEDNAHGFLSQDENGLELGLRGDIGIFSFRKTIPVDKGAAIVVGDSLSPLLPNQLNFSSKASAAYGTKNFLRKMAPLGVAPLIRKTQLLTRFFRRLEPTLDLEVEQTLPPDLGPPANLVEALQTFDVESEKLRRQRLFKALSELIVNLGGTPLISKLEKKTVPFGFPFFADNSVFPKIEAQLNELGLDCMTWPDLPLKVRKSSPDYYHHLRCVRFLW